MKKLYLTFLLLFFFSISFGQNKINIDDIQPQGNIFYEKFTTDVVSGIVFKLYNNKEVVLGKIVKGKKEGDWIEWYDNGKMYTRVTFSDGKRIGGTFNSWYENGNKWMETVWDDSKKKEKWIHYHIDGWINNEHFVDNNSNNDGLKIIYDKYGNKKEEEIYDKGIKIKGTYFYLGTNQKKLEFTYKNEKVESSKGWYKGGELESTQEYLNGRYHGEGKHYYETGELFMLSNYKYDKMNGMCYTYDKNGKILRKFLMKNDEMIKKYKWKKKLPSYIPEDWREY